MNNNSWFKKEMPLQTVIGFGGGATGFGAHSSAASKLYVDDVFSTTLYTGNMTDRNINTGVDMSGKGGLAWLYVRAGSGGGGWLFDTERGYNKFLRSSDNYQEGTETTMVSGFTSTGFSLDGDGSQSDNTNANGADMASWNFRKQKGFFDVVTYTGNGSARTISHGLGSIPGLIMIKCTSSVNSWYVYHRELGATKYLMLNSTDSNQTQSWFMNDTAPTSSVFSLGTSTNVNGSGETYVAYIFAGGESDAATARSVYLSGNTDEVLTTAHSSDFDFGSGDFTVEAWAMIPGSVNNGGIVSLWNYNDGKRSWSISGVAGTVDTIRAIVSPDGQWGTRTEIQGTAPPGQWNHLAFTRSGNTLYYFINGDLQGSASFTGSVYNNTSDGIMIGGQGAADDINSELTGYISNVRVVKGTAVYTSPFKPPTEPLTNITNTKILCCNNSSVTGSTVTPGTITAHGSPTASTDSPFDDPNGFKFGENEDQSIIKTGKYIGNGATDGPEVYVGFEPQWLLIRGAGGGDWNIVDNMRGIVTGGNDNRLWANSTDVESTSLDVVDITPTGFKITHDGSSFNSTSSTPGMLYMAIRRPDGYVGKPPSAGTGAFTMDTGNASTTIPVWDSGFPVDFAMNRAPASTTSWYTSARLIQDYYLLTNGTNARNQDNGAYFDSNAGWAKDGYGTWDSTYQSWMWKRGQGMDVVTYTGNGSNVDGDNAHAHNLGQTPEMIWIHPLYGGTYSGVTHWTMSHKGLNEGTNPWQYTMSINNTWAEAATSNFGNTAPSSTHFYVGDPGNGRSNDNGTVYMAMLFASANDADGNPISKVGSYEGSNSPITITTGFQPRFFFVKRYDQVGNWTVFDTLRGWASGDDCKMEFNSNGAQNCNTDFGYPTSTGIYLTNDGDTNLSGYKFIYYAHA